MIRAFAMLLASLTLAALGSACASVVVNVGDPSVEATARIPFSAEVTR